jgi:hypothetical protein
MLVYQRVHRIYTWYYIGYIPGIYRYFLLSGMFLTDISGSGYRIYIIQPLYRYYTWYLNDHVDREHDDFHQMEKSTL